MRVLHAIATGDTGGAQTHLADLAAGLAARGVTVAVAVGTAGPLLARLRDAGAEACVVPMRWRPRPRDLAALVRLIRASRPDLVHTHTPLAGIIGRYAALLAGRPAVHTLHGLGIHDQLRTATAPGHRATLRFWRWHERWLNARSAAVIAVSPRVARAALDAGLAPRDRLVIVPNGVAASARAWLPPPRPAVAYAGRLDGDKGVDDLLAAFALASADLPDASLRIAGDGPMRAALERQARDLRLDGRVAFVGEVRDVPAALAGAACLVLPSRAEGLPYVLLEAMALGVPCVAAAVGGVPDLIEHGRTGWLVAPGDRAALARAIVEVVRSPEAGLRIGEAGRRLVSAQHTLDQMIARTLDVYALALRRRAA